MKEYDAQIEARHEQTCKELINLMCGERRSDERSEPNAALYNSSIFTACVALIWYFN